MFSTYDTSLGRKMWAFIHGIILMLVGYYAANLLYDELIAPYGGRFYTRNLLALIAWAIVATVGGFLVVAASVALKTGSDTSRSADPPFLALLVGEILIYCSPVSSLTVANRSKSLSLSAFS